MTTTTLKPADLEAGDRIVSVNGFRQRGLVQVVTVDKVDARYVRYIVTRKGVELYWMAHPNHDIVVDR